MVCDMTKYIIPLIAAIVIIAAVAVSIIFLTGHTVSAQSSPELAQFTALSNATSDQCSLPGYGFMGLPPRSAIYSYVNSQPNDTYFQGSCCSSMVYSHYVAQIEGLKNYSDISAIPPDPYNVSVGLVKQLFSYYTNITLTPSQNATFNDAAGITIDHSWCCCQCWAWYAHAGLAKYLITKYGYNAIQVANVMNLEECCGG